MCDALTERMLRPWLWPDFIFKLSNCWKKQKECLKILHGFTRKVTKEQNQTLFFVQIQFISLIDCSRKSRKFCWP